jgi:hypothetical protein
MLSKSDFPKSPVTSSFVCPNNQWEHQWVPLFQETPCVLFFRQRNKFLLYKEKRPCKYVFVSLLDAHCPACAAHTVLPVRHTLSCMCGTHCPACAAHTFLPVRHRLYCLCGTHCPACAAHTFLPGRHTLSCLCGRHWTLRIMQVDITLQTVKQSR